MPRLNISFRSDLPKFPNSMRFPLQSTCQSTAPGRLLSRMAELDLHPPEHPRFPREADKLQDPHRSPTPHEAEILDVFMRFKNIPDFETLPAPSEQELQAAEKELQSILEMPSDPLLDQDERVLELLKVISDHRVVFGRLGYFLAAEIMNAAKKNIETAEFRRAFFMEYREARPTIRDYLRNVAGLRRRGHSAKYLASNVPQGQWGSRERRAAAQEQMELVQGLPDCYVMEKFWRTLEIVSVFPDFFSKEQFEQLSNRKGIEQAWRAHLAKARQDLNYYNGIITTGQLFRKMVDSAVDVLQRMITEKRQELQGPSSGQQS